MADKNFQMTQRNSANNGWDNLYPATKAEVVQMVDGSALSDNVSLRTVDSINSLMTASAKKSDTLCFKGQCAYKNTATSGGTTNLANVVFSGMRPGRYTAVVRIRSANNALTTDVIQMRALKNNGGTFAEITLRNIKPNEFSATGTYRCFYLDFEYTGTKATNDELKIEVNLLQTSAVFEVALDYIQLAPTVVGVFTP